MQAIEIKKYPKILFFLFSIKNIPKIINITASIVAHDVIKKLCDVRAKQPKYIAK